MKMIIYLAQVSACTGIFYLFYHLVLARFTFFTINRWYLLGTLLLSFFIPLVTIPADAVEMAAPIPPVSFSTIQTVFSNPVVAVQQSVAIEEPLNWGAIISSVYFLVAGVFALLLFASLWLFYKRIQAPKLLQEGNIKIIKDGKHRNGSFLNYVFINEKGLTPDELTQIIAHELVHAQQMHSIDNVLARIARTILWFNPFAYAYLYAISANHEYEVDRKVAESNDKALYATLILRLATNVGDGLLNSYFSMHPLRRRISMLFNKPTRKVKMALYLFALPLVIISLCCFANREFISENLSIPLKSADNSTQPDIKTVTASKNTQSGPVAISVSSNTKISQPKTTDLEKIQAALKAMKPVADKNEIDSAEKDNEITIKRSSRISVVQGVEYHGNDPIVLIDGKEYDPGVLEQISSKCIAGSSWLNEAYAKAQYGERARDGVVKINTRDGEVVYLTETERENLIMLKKIIPGQFFRRASFKNEDGSIQSRDYISVYRADGTTMMGSSIGHNEKAAFIIDGQVYSERQVAQMNTSRIKSSGGHGVGPVTGYPAMQKELKGYTLVFHLSGKIDELVQKSGE